MKTIKKEAMKTRILTTALMILFTTVIIAEPVRNTNEDTLSIQPLAFLGGSSAPEMSEYGTLSADSSIELVVEDNAGLEYWVESREVWESEASELTVGYGMEPVKLDGWYDSRENWEQESSSLDLSGLVYINNLGEWVTERESWEQSDATRELVPQTVSSFQQDWINERSMWEQK